MHDVTECKFCGAMNPRNEPCKECGYERDEKNPQDIDWKEYGRSIVN